jgi:hypothetical protein
MLSSKPYMHFHMHLGCNQLATLLNVYLSEKCFWTNIKKKMKHVLCSSLVVSEIIKSKQTLPKIFIWWLFDKEDCKVMCGSAAQVCCVFGFTVMYCSCNNQCQVFRRTKMLGGVSISILVLIHPLYSTVCCRDQKRGFWSIMDLLCAVFSSMWCSKTWPQ